MRPIDERRAVPLIVQAYAESGVSAGDGRDVRLSSGKTVHVDVGTAGHKYGVAYLTKADLAGLDPKLDLPPHQAGADDLLPVVKGSGPDADAIILVLFGDDYLYDDLAGEQHESTTITAERKLARDVRDFLVQARAQNLP